MKIATILAILLCHAASASTLIQAGLGTLPSSALYQNWGSRIPSDGAVELFNPPVFKWSYAPLENTTNTLAVNQPVYRFRLELSTNNFSTTNWSIVSSNNFPNGLAPITNANGSTWLGSNYWRVFWRDRSNNSTISTSSVYTFTMAANATTWDRSMLASPDYLTNICGQHPHLLWYGTNFIAVTNYLSTNNLEVGWIRQNIFAGANQHTGQVWWTTNGGAISTNVPDETSSTVFAWGDLVTVGLAFRISGNSNYFGTGASSIPSLAEWLARRTLALGMDHQNDAYTMGGFGKSMALVYDWYYADLSVECRSNMVAAMSYYCKYLYYQFGSTFYQTNATKIANRTHDDSYIVGLQSSMVAGDGHGRLNIAEMAYMTSACVAENPELLEIQRYCLDYIIARYDPFMTDEGNYYGWATIRGYVDYGYVLSMIQFKAANLTNIFTASRYLESMIYRHPLGFREQLNLFGDLSGGQNEPLSAAETVGVMARLRQDGALQRTFSRSRLMYPSFSDSTYLNYVAGYYYPAAAPAEVDYATGHLNRDMGWAVSSTLPPNDYGAFTNGMGFVLSGRPYVNNVGHATYHDGAPFFWAYGACVSMAGVENYTKHPMFAPGLFVDGVGAYHTTVGVSGNWPYHAQISSFTNSATFGYASVDLTHLFNRKGYPVANELGPQYANDHEKLDVTRAERHVLFPGKKFWVVYDVLNAASNHVFAWHWNVLENTLTSNSVGSFTYTTTNQYNRSNVTVYVKHAETGLAVTNLTTSNGSTNGYWRNPFTGENFQATYDAAIAQGALPLMRNSIWIYNVTPETNWNFLSVIYPVKWDKTNAPTITFIDSHTVAVTNIEDSVAEVVTFDTNYASAFTYMVDVGAVATNEPGTGESPGVTSRRAHAVRLNVGTIRRAP